MGWNSQTYEIGSVALNSRDRFNEESFDEFMIELKGKIRDFVEKEVENKFGKDITEGDAMVFVNIN